MLKSTTQNQAKLNKLLEYINGKLHYKYILGADDLQTLHLGGTVVASSASGRELEVLKYQVLLKPQFAHRTKPTCQSDNSTVV